MSELTPQERLQPSLLDRLADDERVIAWRLDEDKTRLLAILDDQERAAFEKLFDVEQRRAPRLDAKDFEPFARLTEEQKALLERVVMLEQQRRFESREQRVMSLERLKQSVLRDLSWLLNTEYFEAVHSLEALPRGQIERAQLWYSLDRRPDDHRSRRLRCVAASPRPCATRSFASSRASIRTASWCVPMPTRSRWMAVRSTFEIEAELLAEPAPLRLLLTSVVDLENGHASLAERAA